MADKNTETLAAAVPGATEAVGLAGPPASTPLRRVAGRLQSVLPRGWCVEVVDGPERGRGSQPILRVLVPAE
ncbi:hypothetical protein [Nocardia donostiensis]|uniref:Uncharacterized protein n=1 Tax=Nocardia donostiensis TaxID=1538463 RepID=A0A1W0AQK9_9NOCA|nr:hypothetical protein [Nocardia donostiensis]ONM46580.1 hypothetical protein B0T46_21895 [Nocardia donostiensis]OQS12530.1 hypothetical protein B0T36_24645 [Nocardia donostiensis]OQS19020.1 hypothetical protein B0T44_16180 [Nocardia donostiensis]